MSGMNLVDATRTLAMLVRLDFPLADGLSQMGPADSLWGRAAEKLRQGEEPEQAFSEFGVVSPLLTRLLASALASPTPGPVLESLSRWLETAEQVRAEARLALTYPLALVCCLLVELGILLMVALPSVLAPLLLSESAGALLSTLSQLFGFTAVVVAVGLLWAARGDRIFALAARLPRLDSLLRLVDQALWARAMAALLRAGVELPQALTDAPRMIVSPALREQLTTLSTAVSQGTHLSRALSDLPAVDAHLTWAVAAGESQEELASSLARAATQLESRLKGQAAMLLKLLEPFALVLVGLLTVALLSPFLLALYSGAQSLTP